MKTFEKIAKLTTISKVLIHGLMNQLQFMLTIMAKFTQNFLPMCISFHFYQALAMQSHAAHLYI